MVLETTINKFHDRISNFDLRDNEENLTDCDNESVEGCLDLGNLKSGG